MPRAKKNKTSKDSSVLYERIILKMTDHIRIVGKCARNSYSIVFLVKVSWEEFPKLNRFLACFRLNIQS